MHEAGYLKTVLWDNPEEWDGEGGRSGVWQGGRSGVWHGGTHVHLWLIYVSVWQKNTTIL